MPTDGADFGRMKSCYGKAYTMAREGADNADIAETAIQGLERDIKRDGGAPAFKMAVELLIVSSSGQNYQQLLSGVERLRNEFPDSTLTRYLAAAVETLGLTAINEGYPLSESQASKRIIVHLAESRCCDGMLGYIERNRTHDASASLKIVESIKDHLPKTVAVPDLAFRMRNCSPKGLPAKAPKVPPLVHTTDGLGEEI